MQTSGTFGALSDGMRKTMTRHMAPAKAAPSKPAKASAPKPAASVSTHRRGGHADHSKGGR